MKNDKICLKTILDRLESTETITSAQKHENPKKVYLGFGQLLTIPKPTVHFRLYLTTLQTTLDYTSDYT